MRQTTSEAIKLHSGCRSQAMRPPGTQCSHRPGCSKMPPLPPCCACSLWSWHPQSNLFGQQLALLPIDGRRSSPKLAGTRLDAPVTNHTPYHHVTLSRAAACSGELQQKEPGVGTMVNDANYLHTLCSGASCQSRSTGVGTYTLQSPTTIGASLS